jgi:hypothetical protein
VLTVVLVVVEFFTQADHEPRARLHLDKATRAVAVVLVEF